MESNPDRFPKNDTRDCSRLDPERKAEIEKMLQEGVSVRQITSEMSASKNTVMAVRDQMEDSGKFDLGSWKKQTINNLAKFVNKGSTRLEKEVENIPAGQLPLALAIAIDKIMALQYAPAVVVEHRLRISADDINTLLKIPKQADQNIIDVEPEKES
jgi:transposase-like protein